MGNNTLAGIPTQGVARNSKLIPIQVFSRFNRFITNGGDPICGSFANDCALTWTSDQLKALNLLYDNRNTYNIASINMSLGGGQFTSTCDSDPLQPIISLLRLNGIATVIASGNDGFTNAIGGPACISDSIAVGASQSISDTRASFSNNSTQLDLYAPGVGINSSIPPSGYASLDGTSMATPHVAGAWAVIKEKCPAISVSAVESVFDITGVEITSNGITRDRIDIEDALDIACSPGSTPGSALSYYPLTPCRVVDTRLSSTGTPIPRHGVLPFFLIGNGGFSDQGGDDACNIPLGAKAVVANITSAGQQGGGFFQVYPYTEPQSDTSIINYQVGVPVANASVIPVCPLCVYDVSVSSPVAASHLIVDILGYYQ